jgi:YidC/Oxa1 family membrane protein insertase
VAVVNGESNEREIVVDTNAVQVVFSNRGGRVIHWLLKGYAGENGTLVDLVPSGVPAGQPSPFSLQVDDAAITKRLNETLYTVSGDSNGRVDATSSPASVVFEFQDASGLRVRKTFAFDPNGYVLRFSADVASGERAINPTITWGPGLGDIGARAGGGSFFTGNYVQPPQAIFEKDGSIERVAPERPCHQGAAKRPVQVRRCR